MDFELNEVQEMLRGSAARFLSDCDNLDARRSACGSDFVSSLWRSIVELGWTGIDAPEDCGGFGGSVEDLLVMLTELGSGRSAALMIGNVILPSFLLRHCNTPAGRALLERLIAGELAIAFAGYEPERHHDLAARTTVAIARDTHFTLNGAKSLAIGGMPPDHLLVTAAFANETTLFSVPVGLRGVELCRFDLIDGTVAVDARFDGVLLGPQHQLATGASLSDSLEAGIDLATLCVCAAVWGCMRRALELTTEYLKTRRQFGKYLADFQVLQHRVADMYIATHDAKSILLRAVAAMDEGPLERQRAVSAAKLKLMNAAQWVTGEAVQLHGGIGFTEEYEVGHLFQKAVVGERLFGDVDYHIERYMQLSGG